MDITAAALSPTTDHHHSTRCWWNHLEARWICPATPPVSPPDPESETPLVDVRDMIVVHTALLREFRLAPAAVARVAAGDRRGVRRVEKHLALLCDLLHHHHAGEDELLWPALRDRIPATAIARLEAAEAQHAGLEEALGRVGEARRRWVEQADDGSRDGLVDALRDLHPLLAEHLDDEERTLLPLAAAHLTEAQWQAVGEAGAASVPKSALPLVFGMFAYEGDPAVLADMLQSAPAVPRMVVPRIAPRIYARHAARIHGTARP